MTKKIILFALFIVFLYRGFAQEYTVEGTTPDLHLSHTVSAKETWYSIGRIYNLAPKDIATYNKLNINTPLEIGKTVQIPLTPANFSQSDVKAAGETFVPVYHVVQPKEWLYRISVNYNKVPVETLQKWNSIGKDGAKPGTRLIVGYLKVKDANAMLAPKTPVQPEEKAPVEKNDVPVKNDVASKPTTPEVKAQDTKTPNPKATMPRSTESRPADTTPVEAASKAPAAGREGSYFKNLFDDTGKSSAGITGIFKSTSGWNDGKYYALASNVPVGTIVKITYPSTNKSIYAKVLGELPDMKESAGLALRISDAAAYELGSPDSKFSVNLRY